MASTRLGYLAIKKETTLATAVTPSHFIRFKGGDIKFTQEIIANDPIQHNRWKAINAVPGKVTTEGTYNFDLDPNESPFFFDGALGTMVSTDVSSGTDTSVYRHRCDMANTLKGYTIEQGKGDITDTTNDRQNYQIDRAYGCMVDSITISGADGIINMDVALKAHGVFQGEYLVADAAAGSSVDLSLSSVEGLTTSDSVNIYDKTPQSENDAIASIDTANRTIQIATLGNSYTVANNAKVELIPLSPTYATPARVFSFIHASFQFGADLTAAASASEENVENWEFAYMNNLEERFGSLRASPSVIGEKGAKATLKYTKYFENVEDKDRYRQLTRRACILTLSDDVIISATDTNNQAYEIQIDMSDLRFTSYDLPTGSDELYALTVEAELFYDISDGRAVRVDIFNGKAGTDYTA